MYVCLCNGYRDSELRQLACEGVSCAREAYRALGNGPCCGRCLECAQEIMDEASRAGERAGAGFMVAPDTLAPSRDPSRSIE